MHYNGARRCCCSWWWATTILVLIGGQLQLARADLDAEHLQEKLNIYTKLFSNDPLAKPENRDEIMKELEQARQLEEASANGGRTTMELDLINLGQVDGDRCLEYNLFPKIAWLKRRFNSAPIIFNYLSQIEQEQTEICRDSFPTDYAMSITHLTPEIRTKLRDLTKRVASTGVHLATTRLIPEERLVKGVASFIQSQLEGQVKPAGELPASVSLSRDESKRKMNEFLAQYKSLKASCRQLLASMGPLMQVAAAVGEQVLDLDSTLRDLQADTIVCQNFNGRPHLVTKMGEKLIEIINKLRKTQSEVRLEPPPKKPRRKLSLGSFKFWPRQN